MLPMLNSHTHPSTKTKKPETQPSASLKHIMQLPALPSKELWTQFKSPVFNMPQKLCYQISAREKQVRLPFVP